MFSTFCHYKGATFRFFKSKDGWLALSESTASIRSLTNTIEDIMGLFGVDKVVYRSHADDQWQEARIDGHTIRFTPLPMRPQWVEF